MEREPSNRSDHAMNMNFILSYSTPISQARDKQSTISEILDAAKDIINNDGIHALKINRLARESGRSKSTIYDYFGNIHGVLSAVLICNDPWMQQKKNLNRLLDIQRDTAGRHLTTMLLQNHFISYLSDPMTRAISISELTEKNNPSLQFLTESREKFGEEIFDIITPLFKDSDLDIRVVLALLIGGINYLVLHREGVGGTFCGIDIKKDKTALLKTVDQLIGWSYENAESQSLTGSVTEESLS